MPFARPTLAELISQAEAEIEASLPGADATLRRTVLGVVARTVSGAVHGLYGHLDWLAGQVLPDTAEAEFLERHASIRGLERKAAAFAAGPVIFTGTDGVVIPEGTELRRPDGIRYATVAGGTVDAGMATVGVRARLAGSAGLMDAGRTLNLTSPIAGLGSAVRIGSGGLTGGVDEETDEALLERLLTRIRKPPHGGADFDYVAWALNVPGVTRAWVYPQELGIGTVTVRFMMDGTYPDGIPGPDDVAIVQAYIDRVRPVTASVMVAAPVPVPLDMEISGLDPASQTVKDAIEAELKDLIRREAEPGSTILISHIREAISIAAGETDHVLVSPVANVTHGTGRIAILGAVTWR